MKDWYDIYIEEPIRDIVKLLRNNGINTTSSCGHKMTVECEYYIGNDEVFRIYHLLYNHGYRNFNLTAVIEVIEGHPHSFIEISIFKKRR